MEWQGELSDPITRCLLQTQQEESNLVYGCYFSLVFAVTAEFYFSTGEG